MLAVLLKSSNSDPTAAFLVGLCAGLFSFFKGFKMFRESRVLADTPRIAIRGVAIGFVHVAGKAENDGLVPSPVTRTPCCLYRVDIERWVTERNSSTWRRERSDVDGPGFHLTDDTGSVAVDGRGAELDLDQMGQRIAQSESYSSSHPVAPAADGAPSNEDLLAYVSRAGMAGFAQHAQNFLQNHFSGGDPQHQPTREFFLEMMQSMGHSSVSQVMPSADVFQKMLEAQSPLSDPRKEQARQMILERLKTVDPAALDQFASFKISSASGRYRLTEYCVLPGQEYQITGTCMPNPKPRDAKDRNLIALGRDEKTFVISRKSETQVVSGERWRAVKWILGGAAASIIFLVLLLAHLKLL